MKDLKGQCTENLWLLDRMVSQSKLRIDEVYFGFLKNIIVILTSSGHLFTSRWAQFSLKKNSQRRKINILVLIPKCETIYFSEHGLTLPRIKVTFLTCAAYWITDVQDS